MIRRLSFELRYALGDPRWDSGISPPELLAYLERTPPGRAVDIGCGTGTNAVTMAQRGWQVLGIDFSYLAIKRARQRARHAGVEVVFRRADIARLKLDGPFDLVLDIGCFHSLTESDRERHIAMISDALRPGGTFLLYSFLGHWVQELELRAHLEGEFQIQNVDHGEDQVADRPSAWFTIQRVMR